MNKKLDALRQEMKKENIQAYIVPTSDDHDTEYVCSHFMSRSYLSGFTGSAGTLVVGLDQAALWTDGRYFIQAKDQLAGSGIDLMKMGVEGTPSISAYIVDHLSSGSVVGFDGRLFSEAMVEIYEEAFDKKDLILKTDLDLVDRIWKDRPVLPHTSTFHFEKQYAGKTMVEKIAAVRDILSADHLMITKVDQVAWLFNLRAHDIPSFPVAMAYAIVSQDKASIYIDDSRLDATSRELFAKNHVTIRPYDAIYTDVQTLTGTVSVDPYTINSTLYRFIEADIEEEENPIELMKACKNEVEIEQTKHAHLKDAIAMTQFMYWLKTNVGKIPMSEMSAAQKLHDLRASQADFIEDSFATIAAYKEHGAIVHYQSSPETDVPLQPEGLFMVDSGGHYYQGTTDITRTFVLGEITEYERKCFTWALQCHIRLEQATWLYGCTGEQLDMIARQPLWKHSLDFKHGTGHGVGHVLSVHEGPNVIRWQQAYTPFEAGMITSDEPGIYIEGQFGIRHENEVLAVNLDKNAYGQFMGFEPLTWVPFDVDGLDVDEMQPAEVAWLNAYHAKVYEKVSPYLNEQQRQWLAHACRPLIR
ncbi:MAG: aminopeptidase P family protein [Absicoccus porci]|uniref:aminopeptidase P family protein n=1 Tax=Absicoccus porci TaxID=2486576 RepID=UPI00156903C0|nr:aminopeptidase P family protein [Absicoccus porci]MDD6460027.1 aminopeptidase P family protein [Absicoccus porci]